MLDTDVAVGLISQIGAGGDRETAVIGDAARFFAFFGLYGEGQYVIDGASDTQITGGLRLDIPAWLDGTIVTSAEYQWLPENTDSEHRVFLDISGIPLSRDLRAGISALAAPDASLIVFRGTVRWNVNQNLDAALSGRYQCYPKTHPHLSGGELRALKFRLRYRQLSDAACYNFYRTQALQREKN